MPWQANERSRQLAIAAICRATARRGPCFLTADIVVQAVTVGLAVRAMAVATALLGMVTMILATPKRTAPREGHLAVAWLRADSSRPNSPGSVCIACRCSGSSITSRGYCTWLMCIGAPLSLFLRRRDYPTGYRIEDLGPPDRAAQTA